jgi:hypothetical protein
VIDRTWTIIRSDKIWLIIFCSKIIKKKNLVSCKVSRLYWLIDLYVKRWDDES